MINQIIKSVEKLRELYDGVIWFPGALLTPSVSWLVQPKKVNDKSNTHNIFRIKENESVTCRLYCIAFKAI